jgi:hypothetical protein
MLALDQKGLDLREAIPSAHLDPGPYGVSDIPRETKLTEGPGN